MLQKIDPFTIKVYFNRRYLSLKVIQYNLSLYREEFIVKAKNGSLKFESNRPVLRRKGLKHRKPDLALIEGKLIYDSLVEDIKNAIVVYIMDMESKGQS